MDDICRLCLTVSTEMSTNLSENNETVNKIWNCFSIKIELNDIFPNKICKSCIMKIEEMYTYSLNVRENDQKLKGLLIKGISFLQEFYINLNSKVDIKFENAEEENVRLNWKFENLFSSDDEISLANVKSWDDQNEILKASNSKVFKEHNVDKKEQSEININKLEEDLSEVNEEITKHGMEPVLDFKSEDFTIPKCLTCFKKCQNQNDLIKHYMSEHSNEKLGKSNFDENQKSVRDYLIKYNENGIKIYVCVTCDKIYEKKKDILRHEFCHKVKRPFICKICGSTYKTVYEIIRHGRVHSGHKLHCSFKCGFSTAYSGALRDHEKRHSKSGDKYTCKKCGKGFQVKTWYEQHQNVHTGQKPYVCDICGVSFHMHRYLTSHLSKVHPQSSELKRYVCVHCLLPCDSRNSLKKHMEEHGIKTTFLCDLCGKIYPNAEQLKYHKNVHLGVKPFSCSTCDKTFSRKFHLKIHEQTHTGERKHLCSKCSKYFTQRSTLLRHTRRHHPVSSLKANEESIRS